MAVFRNRHWRKEARARAKGTSTGEGVNCEMSSSSVVRSFVGSLARAGRIAIRRRRRHRADGGLLFAINLAAGRKEKELPRPQTRKPARPCAFQHRE